jgi:hypothetical protein
VSEQKLYRNTSASTASTTNWTELTGVETAVNAVGASNITSLTTTRGLYDNATASIFIGTNNGNLFRLNAPLTSAAVTAPDNIKGAAFPAGYISSIATNPRNDDTALVTFSNYGIVSLWWTGNANAATPTWANVEGNLTLPSCRSSIIAVTADGVEYFVGTSVGLFRTTINGASPGTTSWVQDGASEVGNAVVTSLSLRPSDNKLLVGTHGYGMWQTTLSMVILPVTLRDFKGSLNNNSAQLEWSTSSEQNSRQFDVQKSTDGVNYQTIGIVKAAGNSSSQNNYGLRDTRLSENNYYRLKMVDLDAGTAFSRVVLIRKTGVTQNIWVLNNPFHSYIDLRFAKPTTGKTGVELFDVKGKLLVRRTYSGTSGLLRVDLSDILISSGAYILKVSSDGQSFTSRVIKQ